MPGDASALTQLWVERLVVGEGLCPFAQPVMSNLLIDVCDQPQLELLTESFLSLLLKMSASSEDDIPTALFVCDSDLLQDFDDYLDWLAICEELLAQAGLEGDIQLASFHPHYQFDGEDDDDMSHYSNRSPFPMLHLIRENHISAALATVTRPEAIPERNKRHMRRLGREGLLQLMPELRHTAVFRD